MKLEPQETRPRQPTAEPEVLLHALATPSRRALASSLEHASYGDLKPLVGSFARPVVDITGPAEILERAGNSLPDGPARPEAMAVRLRREGVELDWGEPRTVPDLASLVRLERARGASSIEMTRADPTLLSEMQVGAYFDAYWRRRVVRASLAGLRLPRLARWIPAGLAAATVDASFWLGVRSKATDLEWERLARSSYVVFYYHRIAERATPGQERMNVQPRRFEHQIRVLRRLGYRPLSAAELLAFHSDPEAALAGRRYLLAADDAFADAVDVLEQHADLHPHVFVCTSFVGEQADWAAGEPLASWDQLRALDRAGGVVESHSRSHAPLTELDQHDLKETLSGALRDLEDRLAERSRLLSYPHGIHDARVRSAAIDAGYRAAFTTEPGRNGAGTDVYCLRRIGLKDWDGSVTVAWKALTGEFVPWFLERRASPIRGAIARRTGARTRRRPTRR